MSISFGNPGSDLKCSQRALLLQELRHSRVLSTLLVRHFNLIGRVGRHVQAAFQPRLVMK